MNIYKIIVAFLINFFLFSTTFAYDLTDNEKKAVQIISKKVESQVNKKGSVVKEKLIAQIKKLQENIKIKHDARKMAILNELVNSITNNLIIKPNQTVITDKTAQTECTTGMTEITLSNGQTWACKNLGATEVGLDKNSYGDYYQWGKDNEKWIGNGDIFTKDGSGTTKEGRQGPCTTGWHVPSTREWREACDSITSTRCTFGMDYNSLISTKLKLPFAGYRVRYSGSYLYQYTGAYYWSSSPTPVGAYNLYFTTSKIRPMNDYPRALGFSVRCLKN